MPRALRLLLALLLRGLTGRPPHEYVGRSCELVRERLLPSWLRIDWKWSEPEEFELIMEPPGRGIARYPRGDAEFDESADEWKLTRVATLPNNRSLASLRHGLQNEYEHGKLPVLRVG